MVLAGLALACCAPVIAQGQCSITGNVQDSTGAVLPNVTVEINASQYPDVYRSGTTDASGHFTFSNVPCGRYTIRATAHGFGGATKQSSTVASSEASVTLTIGGVAGESEPDRNEASKAAADAAAAASKAVDAAAAASKAVDAAAAADALAQAQAAKPVESSLATYPLVPTWNAWEESTSPNDSPSFEPEASLRPNSDYTLTVDLSVVSYGKLAGLAFQSASPETLKVLSQPKAKTVHFEVVILPDGLAFDSQKYNERVTSMDVDLKQVRAAEDSKIALPDAPLEALKSDPNAAFKLGRVRARIHTRAKIGLTTIAVSIWNNGTPVDEFAIPVCISRGDNEPCAQAEVASFSLRGNDTLGPLSSPTARPDAALQFIELDESRVEGVFRCNSCKAPEDQGYQAWTMPMGAAELSQNISGTIVKEFNAASNAASTDADFYRLGESLYWTIFKDPITNSYVPPEASFRRFVDRPGGTNTSQAPSLFVRFMPAHQSPLLLLPIGLLVVPGAQDRSPLATRLRIGMPLENQIYDVPSTCIDHWRLLVPDPNDMTISISKDVNAAFSVWNKSFSAWSGHAVVYGQDLKSFDSWLNGEAKDKSNNPTAILIISHQQSDQIFYSDSETPFPTIDSKQVQREFARPSVVILDACGSAGPGQADFVRQFNLRGVATIVATAYEVNSVMAGVFAARFMRHLRFAPRDSNYTISNAFLDAVNDVSKTSQGEGLPTYGQRAFAYMLLGNGSLRVCAPPFKSAQTPQGPPGNN